jgi:hypothetical protein
MPISAGLSHISKPLSESINYKNSNCVAMLQSCNVIFCHRFVTHSQKKSSLFTAHCVLEPLVNERRLIMINVK